MNTRYLQALPNVVVSPSFLLNSCSGQGSKNVGGLPGILRGLCVGAKLPCNYHQSRSLLSIIARITVQAQRGPAHFPILSFILVMVQFVFYGTANVVITTRNGSWLFSFSDDTLSKPRN